MAAGQIYYDNNGDSGSYLVYHDSSDVRRRINVFASGHALPTGVTTIGSMWIVWNAGSLRIAKSSQGNAMMVDTNGSTIVATSGGVVGRIYVSGTYLYSVDNRGYVVRHTLGATF